MKFDILKFFVSLVITLGAGFLGSIATNQSVIFLFCTPFTSVWFCEYNYSLGCNTNNDYYICENYACGRVSACAIHSLGQFCFCSQWLGDDIKQINFSNVWKKRGNYIKQGIG